jgi:hypothetical protein
MIILRRFRFALLLLAFVMPAAFGAPISYTWYSYDTYAYASGGQECYGSRVVCDHSTTTDPSSQHGYADVTRSTTSQSFSSGVSAGSNFVFKVDPNPDVSCCVFGGSGLYSAAATDGFVEFGQIHASASSSAGSEYTSWALPSGAIIQNTGLATASASASAGWNDQISIVSDKLQKGTQVDVRVGFALHSLVGGLVTPTSSPCTAYSNPYARLLGGAGFLGNSSFEFMHNPCNGTELMWEERVLHAVIGDVYNISSGLVLQTGNGFGVGQGTGIPNGNTVNAFIDARNTSTFWFDILTPGADYIAVSGTRFLTELPPGQAHSVPEPSTLALFGVWPLLAICMRRRIRRESATVA